MRKIAYLLGQLFRRGGGFFLSILKWFGPLAIVLLLLAWWLVPKITSFGSNVVDTVDSHTKGIQHTAGSIISAVDCTLGGASEDALGQGTKRLTELNQELTDLQVLLADAEANDGWGPNWLGFDSDIKQYRQEVKVKQAEIIEQQKELQKMIDCWASLKRIPAGGWGWLKDQFSNLGDWGQEQIDRLGGSSGDSSGDGDEEANDNPVHEPDTLRGHDGKEVILFQ